MKLKFKHQGFQRDAAKAVTDVFIGQRKSDGFSYRFDGPLDMRMNKDAKLTAEMIVNEYSKEELQRIT